MANDKPKWQRARARIQPNVAQLYDSDGFDQSELRQRSVWVTALPFCDAAKEYLNHAPDDQLMLCNVTFDPPNDNQLRVINLRFFELLPEFADDVPIIPWEEFINGR